MVKSCPMKNAKISVLDHGLYGDGLFEGIRVRVGRIFRIEQHLARLQARRACAVLRARFAIRCRTASAYRD